MEKKIIEMRDKIRRGELLDYQKKKIDSGSLRTEVYNIPEPEISRQDQLSEKGRHKKQAVVAPLIFQPFKAPHCYSSNLTPAN